MKGYTVSGKQVRTPDGIHFADAASDVAAMLIVVALNYRNHRPAIDGEHVICSRCQHFLPDDAAEPCIPRAPRCTETPDLFEPEPEQDLPDAAAA